MPIIQKSDDHRGRVRGVIGYIIAALCLVWVFHDMRWSEFGSAMADARWEWIAVAILCDVTSYVFQGLRWKLLLRPIGDLSVLKTTQAVYVGLFTNEIVPLRAGELVRVYLVSRWLGTDLLAVLPSYLVERLFDGIWLALAIGLAALFVPLPHRFIVGEEVLGAIVLVLLALFLLAVFRRRRSRGVEGRRGASTWRPVRALAGFIDRLADGLQRIGTGRMFYLAAVASAFILVFQMLSLWLVLVAMRVPLSLGAGAVVLLVLHLGTTIPNAPSNIGSYQFFTVVGLSIFHVDKTAAAGASIVAYVVLTLPLWIIGLAALRGTGMSFARLRAEVAALRR